MNCENSNCVNLDITHLVFKNLFLIIEMSIELLYDNEIKKLYEISKMYKHLEDSMEDYEDGLENYNFENYIEDHFYHNIDNLVLYFEDTDLLDILNKLYENDNDKLQKVQELRDLYVELHTIKCEGEFDGYIDFIGEQNFIMSQIVFKDILKIAKVDFEIIKKKIFYKNKDGV